MHTYIYIAARAGRQHARMLARRHARRHARTLARTRARAQARTKGPTIGGGLGPLLGGLGALLGGGLGGGITQVEHSIVLYAYVIALFFCFFNSEALFDTVGQCLQTPSYYALPVPMSARFMPGSFFLKKQNVF